MRSVPGGATGFGIGAGLRVVARFALGAALAFGLVFFLAATFLATFLRPATLPVEVFFFFALVLAFFLVAIGRTSTLKTETDQENDASPVNGLPEGWGNQVPSAPKHQFKRSRLLKNEFF